jgi:hypothetical protein
VSLTPDQIDRFVVEGFVKLEGAFPLNIGKRCVDELWAATGCSAEDPTTWTEPVIRLGGFSTPPFREAANTRSGFPLPAKIPATTAGTSQRATREAGKSCGSTWARAAVPC